MAARIVMAAAELLDETGNEAAVTLRGVARRAGVSAPAIYGHYPDVQAIFLVVVQDAFAELFVALQAAAMDARSVQDVGVEVGDDVRAGSAVARLRAVCSTYLEFALNRPQRYRIMFGGVWTATTAIEAATVSRSDVEALGQDTLSVFMSVLQTCVQVGASSSADVGADAVALWLGLHGLAHQRGATAAFPWPADIDRRLVDALAHLGAT